MLGTAQSYARLLTLGKAWALLGACLLCPAAGWAQSGTYSGYFQELEANRELAYQAAVTRVAKEALTNLVRSDGNLLDCLSEWIRTDLAPDYKDLVRNPLFDIDREIKRGQWALEGSLSIDMTALNRWVRQQLDGSGCGPELSQRRTIYIEPPGTDDAAADEIITAAHQSIQQLFASNGYRFVDYERRQTAEFRLVLESAKISARGPVATLVVTGLYVDNRADGQPYLALRATADERLRTTEAALHAALYENQARSVLAQVSEWEAAHLVEQHDVELRFVSRRESESSAGAVLDEVVALLNLPAEFQERADAIQVTSLDGGRVEMSIFIPAKYGVSLTRSHLQAVRDIAARTLGYEVAASEFSDNATRLTVVDAAAVQAAWEREFWEYLGSGDLTVPEDRSALGVVRRQLAANPRDGKALGFLDEIVGRLVQRAIYKLGQGALTSANADLTLAESVGAERPGTPWAAARRELSEAIARERTRINAESSAPGGRPPSDRPPLVLFPEIESAPVRGVVAVAAERGGLLGIAADADGIKSIALNGVALKFERAAESRSALLSVPGAFTEEFYLPQSSIGSGEDLRVVVIDGRNNRVEKTLTRRGDAYVVASAAQPASDAEILKEGEAALAGTYHALIIANQAYDRLNDLDTPVADGDALKAVLIGQYNFDPRRIYELKNGTRQQMEHAIDELQDKVGPNDSLLIYFAGHGDQDPGHGGAGFWIPVDGRGREEPGHRTSWVPNVFVADYVKRIKARHVLLISDSCYAGTFAQRGDAAESFIATTDFVMRKAGQNSRRAMTSGDIEPVLDAGGAGHSIFAHHLLTALREHPGQYLTAEQLFRAVYDPVTGAAQQRPQYFVMSDNDRGGDFVFVRKPAAAR